jgi:hypothetical protein
MNRARTLAIAAVAVLATAGLSACGDNSFEHVAANEGIYFKSGPLTYQVQITRQLNLRQPQDAELMQGVSAADRKVAGDVLWYATFLRIENQTPYVQLPANVSEYSIADTNGDIFRPVNVNPLANSFAYVGAPLAAGAAYPNINSIPGQTDINGKMLLFKIPRAAISQRPLELRIVNPTDLATSGRVALDI